MNSRNKGAAGERELANWLKERGYEAKRGQQHKGGVDSPDVVVDIPGVHIECKRTERFAIYDALDQARSDAGPNLPIVAHRCNGNKGARASCRGEWLAVLSLDDLLTLLAARRGLEGVI